jgi:hypothetical protein
MQYLIAPHRLPVKPAEFCAAFFCVLASFAAIILQCELHISYSEQMKMREENSARGAARKEQGLRMLERGLKPTHVASAMGVHVSTVVRWRDNRNRKFNKHRTTEYNLNRDEQSQVLKFMMDFHPRTLRKPRTLFADIMGPWECVCEETVARIVQLVCPNCHATDPVWTTRMVRELIRIRYPYSIQARYTNEDVERWLRDRGYVYNAVEGWRPEQYPNELHSTFPQ